MFNFILKIVYRNNHIIYYIFNYYNFFKIIFRNSFISKYKSVTNLKFIGQVLVTDGDTLRKGKLKIRLHGIDAPKISRCVQI